MEVSKKIFILSFFVACLGQWFIITGPQIPDFDLWSAQAKWMETGDPKQFDLLGGYGHPGGPLIEGVIGLRYLLNLSYDNALLVFMLVSSGLLVAASVWLCFKISPNKLWWPVVLVTLSFSTLYISSTPPSITVSLFVVLSCLFSIYLYQKEKPDWRHILILSLLFGLMVATRFDIGGVMIVTLLAFLKPKLSGKRFIYTMLGIGSFFVLFDPFMWYMPIIHISDLFVKIYFHYESIAAIPMTWLSILSISCFSMVSIFLSLLYLSNTDYVSPIPRRFLLVFMVTTIILYMVFLTARSQAIRYFLPLIIVWETLLPILLIKMGENFGPLFRRFKMLLISLLFIYPIYSLVYYLL